jgi:uncharacterized membrane protein
MNWQLLLSPLAFGGNHQRELGFLAYNYRILDERKALLWMCLSGTARILSLAIGLGYLFLSPLWVAVPAVGILAPSRMRWTKAIGWAFGATALLYSVLGFALRSSALVTSFMQDHPMSFVFAQSDLQSIAVSGVVIFIASLALRTESVLTLLGLGLHTAGVISLPVCLIIVAAEICAGSVGLWLRGRHTDQLSRKLVGRFCFAEVGASLLSFVFTVYAVQFLGWFGLSGVERMMSMGFAVLVLILLQVLILSIWGHFESQRKSDPDLERKLAEYLAPTRFCRRDREAWGWLSAQLKRRLSEMTYLSQGMQTQVEKIPEPVRMRLAQEIRDIEKILNG